MKLADIGGEDTGTKRNKVLKCQYGRTRETKLSRIFVYVENGMKYQLQGLKALYSLS